MLIISTGSQGIKMASNLSLYLGRSFFKQVVPKGLFKIGKFAKFWYLYYRSNSKSGLFLIYKTRNNKNTSKKRNASGFAITRCNLKIQNNIANPSWAR
jgi:hypothetical protein